MKSPKPGARPGLPHPSRIPPVLQPAQRQPAAHLVRAVSSPAVTVAGGGALQRRPLPAPPVPPNGGTIQPVNWRQAGIAAGLAVGAYGLYRLGRTAYNWWGGGNAGGNAGVNNAAPNNVAVNNPPPQQVGGQHTRNLLNNFLAHRQADNPDLRAHSNVVDPNRAEPQYDRVVNGVTFRINRGHAFRDHATGVTTNPRFSGSVEVIEDAIIQDVLRRLNNGGLPPVRGIAQPGTGLLFRHIPIRYNAVQAGGRIMISDYMVWQGNLNDLT